jgi:hypothetical protein
MDDFMDEGLPEDTKGIGDGCNPKPAGTRLIEPIGTRTGRGSKTDLNANALHGAQKRA